MFSNSVKGTSKEKPNLSWWEYYIGHCLGTGFQSFRHSIINWVDLVWLTDNQKNYTLTPNEDAFESCRGYFWDAVNIDEVLPKDFLESLLQMVEDVRSGKEETVPYTNWEDFVTSLDLEEDEELSE